MSSLSFGLLGPAIVVGEAGEVAIHGALRRRLLVRLLVSANRPVPTERLREDLWEGEPPASSASTLKSHVSLLRRALGPDRLSHRDGAYLLRVGPDELDVLVFEAEVSSGHRMLRAGEYAEARAAFDRGLQLWRGPALADAADTSWGAPEATRLDELRAAAIESLLEARLCLGDRQEVIADAEAAIAEHQLREGLWAKLISALYLSGRQADALRAYQRLRELLGEELGIMPSRELVVLEGAILRQDFELVPAGPELRSMPATDPARVVSRMPRDLTSFIERPDEVAQVQSLMRNPGLVTLVGAGGTGKTRLAFRVASDLEAEGARVWLCELAPVAEAADVIGELAAAVGCEDHAGADLFESLLQRLGDGDHVVVLDNCEHLLDAIADLAARLLRRLPGLRILTTSRSPLGVAGEAVHRVPSMSVPVPRTPLEELERFEAVRLFVDRAGSQRVGFLLDAGNAEAIASICERLDGIPLALELAAARLRNLSLFDIERRLDDRFKLLTSGARTAPRRQQTLEALIDWSYDLLDEAERTALRRLAVFAGGFDLPAAEAVAPNEQLERSSVLDVIASLVDKSLLGVDTSGVTARYRMLETVRAYAARKLVESEEVSARSAHAGHFLQLVEVSAPHFSGALQVEWRERLEADDDNLRLAFANLIVAPGQSEEALRFAAAVSRFWNSRGLYGNEVDLIEAALDRPDGVTCVRERGPALAAAGYLMFRRGSSGRAQQYLKEALGIAEEIGSAALRADALRTLAWVADRRGDRESAAELAEEAVEAAEESGEVHLIARAYDVRAAAFQQRDPARARKDYGEALRQCRASGDGLGQASALNNLAILDMEQGDIQAARRRLDEALLIAEGVKDAALVPFLEYGVGLAAILDDDTAAAEAAFVASLRSARLTGQRSLVAYAILGIAAVWAASGRQRPAAVLLGASSALFDELGERPESIESTLRNRVTADLRGVLGDSFDEADDEGRALSALEVAQLVTDGLSERPQT